MDGLTLDEIIARVAELPDSAFARPVAVCAEVPEVAPWEGPLVNKIAARESYIDGVGGIVVWSFTDAKSRYSKLRNNILSSPLYSYRNF